jgi:hypothetical protein
MSAQLAAAQCEALLGERLASIRSIRYLSGRETAAAPGPGGLEIETKTGRYLHVAPTGPGTCLIASGPVPGPSEDGASFVRHWTDLTSEVPFAFDGRPVVTRIEPTRNVGGICGCSIEFSNGGRLELEFDAGQPHLTTREAGG